MANTVIGFFDTRAEAEDAVTQLTAAGITRSSIDISTAYSTSNGTINTEGLPSLDGDQKEGNALTRFFNSLFGDDTDDAKKYSDASQYADTIVTVHATSPQQAEDAADILDGAGAVNVDERYASSANYAVSSGYSSGMDANSSMNTAAGYAGVSGYNSDGLTANAGTTGNAPLPANPLAGTRDLDYTGEENVAGNEKQTPALAGTHDLDYPDANNRGNLLSGNREADFVNPSDVSNTGASSKGRRNDFDQADSTGIARNQNSGFNRSNPNPASANNSRDDGTVPFADTGLDNEIRSTGTGYSTGNDNQQTLTKSRSRSRVIARAVEEEYRLRQDHTRIARRPTDTPREGL